MPPTRRGPWAIRSGRPGASTPSGAAILLLAGWACIGLGSSVGFGTYTVCAVTLVAAGTALLVATALGGREPAPWNRLSGVVAGIAALGALGDVMGMGHSDGATVAIRVLVTLAAVTLSLWLILDLPRRRLGAYGVIALSGAAGVAMIHSYPKPAIDVWYMLQAAAHALSHGQNIYTARWTSGVPFEQSNGFAYLPGAAVLLWPFHALFGDVRYGLLAATVATSLLLVHARARSHAVLLGALVLLYPQALFGIGQSWVDPLVLAALCATAYAVTRHRYGWAMLSLAVCLTCKQQAWLLLPLAFLWRDFGWRRAAWSTAAGLLGVLPWAIADPHAFYRSVVAYNLHLPPRMDSLSLFPTVIHLGWDPGLVFTAVATLGAVAFVVWRLPRDTFGFLFGSALVMTIFNLTNRQSFYNEWYLAAGLVLAAVVFGQAGRSVEEPGAAAAGAPVPAGLAAPLAAVR